MHRTFKTLFVTALVTAGIANSALSEEIGRVRVNGNVVILNDDNTWEYAEEEVTKAPDECTVIASEALPVSVCLDPDQWQLGNLGGAYEASFYNKDKDLYVGLITEKQPIALDTFKKAILTNAQSAAKLNKVETVEDESASLGGHEFGHIVYKVKLDGIDFTFSNYFTKFDDKGSLQIVAFTSSDLYEAARPAIDEMIASVKVGE